MANVIPPDHSLSQSALCRALTARCRFADRPVDDVERLASWCREHTPPEARFIGPPGPKTFRLWSRRSLAFNRAASPYHAAGLADWFSRFQDHVALHAAPEVFVRKYLRARHELESRYDELGAEELAGLARRQGADHVFALAEAGCSGPGPLELLHREGRYAVYRVVPGLPAGSPRPVPARDVALVRTRTSDNAGDE